MTDTAVHDNTPVEPIENVLRWIVLAFRVYGMEWMEMGWRVTRRSRNPLRRNGGGMRMIERLHRSTETFTPIDQKRYSTRTCVFLSIEPYHA